jgi:hypothetical protein
VPSEAKSDIVLWVESPGLGDHLIYSTIPELFARRGRRVYISNRVSTRNDEARKLLYDENPFVAGWTDQPPNAGTRRAEMSKTKVTHVPSPIQWVELAHGLPGLNRYPKIYYSPRFLAGLARTVLVDPYSVSQRLPPRLFESFLDRLGFQRDRMRVIRAPYSGPNGADVLLDSPPIRAANIHEYIDIVFSSGVFIGTESGGSALASAIRQDQPTPEIYALTSTLNFNERTYIFPNVAYMVAAGLQRDW